MNLLHPWLPQAERSKATTGLTASALMWQVFTNNVISGFLTLCPGFYFAICCNPRNKGFSLATMIQVVKTGDEMGFYYQERHSPCK